MTSLFTLACPVCWGDAASPMVDGAKAGVAFLLVIIVGVLVAIALIARSWARRARELDAAEALLLAGGAPAVAPGRTSALVASSTAPVAASRPSLAN